MKKAIKSIVAFFAALIGLVGGLFWAVKSDWDWEPIILISISSLELIGFVFLNSLPTKEKDPIDAPQIKQKVNVNVNVANNGFSDSQRISDKVAAHGDRQAIIDSMKSKINVLFIDDDKNFNVVKILKNSGWRNTKSVTDLKSLDAPNVKDTDLFFVDINGVGKLLELPNEGLDLALMLKQKYPQKWVVIYSANKTYNAFHKAWDSCDFKLEKNALPYQFQNLVEECSIKIHK